VIIKAPNRLPRTNIPTAKINVPEILGARERTSLLFDSDPVQSTKKTGIGFHRTTTCLFFMARPAGFEYARGAQACGLRIRSQNLWVT